MFAGFDNEENPSLGGIYLAELGRETPELEALVSIGDPVLGETARRPGSAGWARVSLRRAVRGLLGRLGPGEPHDPTPLPDGGQQGPHCVLPHAVSGAGGLTDQASRQARHLPARYLDRRDARSRQGAEGNFEDFVFWNFSGRVPGIGGGDEGGEDDGEPARWRSSAFIAVSGTATAFKAVTGNRVGVYLSSQPGRQARHRDRQPHRRPARGSGGTRRPRLVTEVGLEREGLRGDWLTVSAKMAVEGGTEEDGMAGVYITQLAKTDRQKGRGQFPQRGLPAGPLGAHGWGPAT